MNCKPVIACFVMLLLCRSVTCPAAEPSLLNRRPNIIVILTDDQGYGDLSASSDLGHTLSIFEALLGQIYLVTVVSVLVSNVGRPPGADRAAA